MNLMVTFSGGVQNISMPVLTDLVCMTCTLQGFPGMCCVNPKTLSLEWLQSSQATLLPR